MPSFVHSAEPPLVSFNYTKTILNHKKTIEDLDVSVGTSNKYVL